MSTSILADDGIQLAWRSLGAQAPTTILVHGWMATDRVWEPIAPALQGAVGGALALRLRIAGEAPPASTLAGPALLERIVQDVLAVARAAGLEQFHLVGHSMGGQVAQLVAAAAPARVRSLVLVNPVPVGGLPLPAEIAAMFRAAGGNRDVLGGILDQACRELTAERRAALVEAALTIAPEWIARAFDAWTGGAPDADLAPIACPTLVVATDDPFLPPDFLRQAVVARIAGAELEVVRGPGHYPQVERPEALAAVLGHFVARASS